MGYADGDKATYWQERSSLLTPIAKSFATDAGVDVASLGIQVHGGMGFIEETGAARYLRDARIAPIYEGTNGVQALDLVGRKLAANGGRAGMSFFAEIDAYIEANSGDAALKPFLDGLATVKAQLQDGTMWLMQNGMANPDNAAGASTDYLHLFGLTALAYMWSLQAKAALARIAGGETDPFYETKLTIGRYYIQRILPETGGRLAKLKTGSELLMKLP
eukprot:gene12833-15681_t